MTGARVTPVDPVRDWAAADLPRRVAALLALPLTAVLWAGSGSLLLVLWTLVGPATYSSLARLLRPEPRQLERTSRHLLASAATAFGVPASAHVLLGVQDLDLSVALGVPALALGLLTAVWGVVALRYRVLGPQAPHQSRHE